jgi:response regulator of citrate/malate metabolism
VNLVATHIASFMFAAGAHGFYDTGELIRKHRPDVLLIESFLEDRDGIRWIKDLATEFRAFVF